MLRSRLESVRSLSDEARLENVIARTHGVRLSVVDIGNGVIRLEKVSFDPIPFLTRCAQKRDFYAADFSTLDWLVDLADPAILALGSIPCPKPNRIPTITHVRAVGSRGFEVIARRHPIFFTSWAEAAGIEPA